MHLSQILCFKEQEKMVYTNMHKIVFESIQHIVLEYSLNNFKRNNWLKCLCRVEQEFPFKCQRLWSILQPLSNSIVHIDISIYIFLKPDSKQTYLTFEQRQLS